MSIMSKIRGNIGLVIGVIALSLVVFIFTSFIGNLSKSNPNDFGVVAGEAVSAEYYQSIAAEFEQNQTDESDPDKLAKRQDDIWQTIVNQIILQQEYKKLGIAITDVEMSKMYLEPPFWHRFVANNPTFRDSLGQVTPEMVNRALDYLQNPPAPDDPNYQGFANFANFMANLEVNIERDRLANMYFGLLTGGAYAPANAAKTQLSRDSQTANISYVKVDVTQIPDDQAKPTDADYEAYYDAHKEMFRLREPMTTISYASFSLLPNAKDSLAARTELTSRASDLKSDPQPLEYARMQSDVPTDTNYTNVLSAPYWLQDGIDNLKKDSILPVIWDDTVKAYAMSRVVNVKTDSNAFYKLRHILMRQKPGEDSVTFLARVDRVWRSATETTWDTLAAAHNTDRNMQSGALKTNLGWVFPGQLGPDMQKAVEAASVGQYIKVKGAMGSWEVVHIQGKSATNVQLATIYRNVNASEETTNGAYERASAFAAKAQQVGSLDSAAKGLPDVQVRAELPLNPSSYNVPGVPGPRSVVIWAFQNEKGKISENPIQTPQAYVIAQVKEKVEVGYQPLDMVKKQFEFMVKLQVKRRIAMEKLKGIGGTDLDKIVAAYGTGATKGTNPSLKYNGMGGLTGQDQDNFAVGKAFGMQAGQVSGPIAGMMAVYVIKLESISPVAAPQQAEVDNTAKQMRDERKSTVTNMCYEGLREIARIEDLRYKRDL